MLPAVDETVNTLLMQWKSFAFVLQLVDVVNVDEAIKRTAKYVVNIRVVPDLCDPALVRVSGFHMNALTSSITLERFHFLPNFNLVTHIDILFHAASLLRADGLLTLFKSLVAGLGCLLLSLKGSVKSTLVV